MNNLNDYIWKQKTGILPMLNATEKPEDVLEWRFWLRCVGVAAALWLFGWMVMA